MKPDLEYLKCLLEKTKDVFEKYECTDCDFPLAEISYIATKKHNHMGICLGIDSIVQMKKYKTKKVANIRSNCNYYNKFYEIDGKVVRIDMYVAGHNRIDHSFIAYYERNYRYLFPYSGNVKTVGRIFVTHFQDDKVIEEYIVDGNQIVYNSYDYSVEGKVYNYYINYVPNGSYPILAESSGYFTIDTLDYFQDNCYVWYQNRQ